MLKSCFVFFAFAVAVQALVSSTPEQVRISTGKSASLSEYIFSWVTNSSTTSTVHIGSSPSSLSLTFNGPNSTHFVDKTCHSSRSLHSVYVSLPKPLASKYFYQVESDGVYSPVLSFSLNPQGPSQFALFGDFGFSTPNLTIYEALLDRAKQNKVDAVFHIGDIAYNMDDNCNQVADDFNNRIQELASSVPYNFGVGNHETDQLYSYDTYTQRVTGSLEGLAKDSKSNNVRYYSVDIGLVHFVVIDTDAWIYLPVWVLAPGMFNWLENDLKAVDRTKTPWIVLLGHRLMYCTKTTDGECNGEALALRYGLIDNKYFGLEALLLKYGVDLYLGGHTHHNEVTWPVAEGTETQTNYIDPKGTVHIQCGMAGVGDGYDPFDVPQESWEQWRDMSFTRAYTMFNVINATHALVELWGNKIGEKPLNSFVIEQNNHGPFQANYETPSNLKITKNQLLEASKTILKHDHHRA